MVHFALQWPQFTPSTDPCAGQPAAAELLEGVCVRPALERKDANDLIYCLEHAHEGVDAVAQVFRQECEGKHGDVVKNALAILRTRFAQTGQTEGYRKDGTVAVAKFELGGENDEFEQREARALR
jgi:hypothetical protein